MDGKLDGSIGRESERDSRHLSGFQLRFSAKGGQQQTKLPFGVMVQG